MSNGVTGKLYFSQIFTIGTKCAPAGSEKMCCDARDCGE